MKLTTDELKSNLNRFYGSETWYRHGLNRNMLYTEGVQYFAENAGGHGAYWLLDIIATEIFELRETEPFIHIAVWVSGGRAIISADDGAGKIVYTRGIDYTDLQEGTWEFYFTDNVLLLPSEY
jgi:hypothetical protein